MNKSKSAPQPSAAPKKSTRKPAAQSPSKKSPASAKTPRAKKTSPPRHPLVDRVCAILDAKKGEHIAVLHVAGVSSVTDYMILCSGLNIPHLRALADEVVRQLRLETPPAACHRRAGSAESEWFVLDYVDFVVHLFTPQMRAYYALEQLWKDAPVVS